MTVDEAVRVRPLFKRHSEMYDVGLRFQAIVQGVVDQSLTTQRGIRQEAQRRI